MDPEALKPARRRRRSAGYAIGAFVAEIDQRLLRNQPPVEELVARGGVVRGIAGEPGRFDLGRISVVIPATDEPSGQAPPPAPAPESSSDLEPDANEPVEGRGG